MKQTLSALLFSFFSVCIFNVQAAEDGAPKVMPSPEEVKKEAQANTKYLAAQALKKARAILEAYGEFAPFGAGLFEEGEVNFVWAVKPGESTEGVNPLLVLNAVRRALSTQAQTGRILGSAVIYQYQKTADGETTPQINIELEYLSGYAEVIATEYKQTGDGIEFAASAKQQYEPRVFVEASNDTAEQ